MEEENKSVIDISPLKKGKRLIVFLGDFFITLILSLILFNLASFPVMKLALKTEDKYLYSLECEKDANQMLLDKKIIFKNPNNSNGFEDDVNYTFKVFLSYYCFDEVNISDTTNPQYGHKIENEVIYNYLVNIKNDIDSYIVAFKEVNQKDNLFDVNETENKVTLKDEYKQNIANELLEINNDVAHSDTYTKIKDNVFARLFYINVYSDILENDLKIDNKSYIYYLNEIKRINNELNWVVTYSCFIAYFIGWLAVYLIFPLLYPNGRTPTMAVLKIDRIGVNNMFLLKRYEIVFQAIYGLLMSMGSLIVLPTLIFDISYCFNLPLIFVFTAICVVIQIASFITVMLDQYNRGLTDILSRSVLILEDDLNSIYNAKGYQL